jgi:hypothetical protein
MSNKTVKIDFAGGIVVVGHKLMAVWRRERRCQS